MSESIIKESTLVFSLSANPELAKSVAKLLGIEVSQDEINHCAETRLCQPCIRVFDSPLLQIFSHALRHGLPLINRSDNPTFGNLEVQALTTAIVVAFADGVLPSSLRPITLVLIALP